MFADTDMLKMIKRYLYSGSEHEIKKEKMPNIRENLKKLLKNESFLRKTLKELKKTKPIRKTSQ